MDLTWVETWGLVHSLSFNHIDVFPEHRLSVYGHDIGWKLQQLRNQPADYLNQDQESRHSWRPKDKTMMTPKPQLSDQKLLNSTDPPDKYTSQHLLITL